MIDMATAAEEATTGRARCCSHAADEAAEASSLPRRCSVLNTCTATRHKGLAEAFELLMHSVSTAGAWHSQWEPRKAQRMVGPVVETVHFEHASLLDCQAEASR